MFDHYDHVSGLPLSCSGAEQDLKRAHAEVEQLRGELHQMRDLSNADLATIDELRGEITALTATLASLRAALARAEETAAQAQARLALATTYTVCAHPDPESIDYDSYAIEVTERSPGQWAVYRSKRCLDANGNWDWEPIPSERTDEWLAAHRFDLPTALQLAHEAAPKIRINGRTATGEGTDHA